MNKLIQFKQYVIPIALVGGVVGIWLYCLLASTVTQDGGVVYYLKAATSKQALVAELSEQGILNHPFVFSTSLIHKYQPN